MKLYKEQIDLLRDLGCDIVQGYYYAKPMIAVGLDKFLVHTAGKQLLKRLDPECRSSS